MTAKTFQSFPGSLSFQLPFHVLAWEAWAGEALSQRDAWRRWAQTDAPWASQLPQAAPVASMPPLLRRRASSADRLALEVALKLAPAGEALPSVFASRHGQVSRSAAMLKAQSAGELCSPMDFSFSVHNATAGQASVVTGDRSGSASLSSRRESFTAALLEAQGLVLEGAAKVLLVISDELPPTLYQGLWQEEGAGYALGLVLGPHQPGTDSFELSLTQGADPALEPLLPQALAFLKALAGSGPGATWQHGQRLWAWQRQ
jgi:Beta-ketoacyl synthase, N-terminal domain